MVQREMAEQLVLGVSIGVLVVLVRWLVGPPEHEWQVLGLAALLVMAVQARMLVRSNAHPHDAVPLMPLRSPRWSGPPEASRRVAPATGVPRHSAIWYNTPESGGVEHSPHPCPMGVDEQLVSLERGTG